MNKLVTSKKLQVSIGISAFNEEGSIKQLLVSIFQQNQETFLLKEIIIASDASTDKTLEVVKSMKNKKIKIISGKERLGKFLRIQQIFRKAKGDIIVILDADIVFASAQTIAQLVAPFYKNEKIGLVGGNRKPIEGKTFIEKAIQTSIRAYDSIAMELRNGNNPYNCHGCILGVSKKFAEEISLSKKIYSDDTFLYFLCLAKNFKFQFAPLAKVWVFTASNLHDAIMQYTRFLGIDDVSQSMFKDLIAKEYYVSPALKYKYIVREFMRMPIHTAAMYLLKMYCWYMSDKKNGNINPAWNIASSTKKRKFSV